MIAVIFNYIGDIEAVKTQFPNAIFTAIPEMIDSSYMIPLVTTAEFTPIANYMIANGTLEVVAGWNKQGQKDAFTDIPKKYTKFKYTKFLRERWNYDDEGNKTTKVTLAAWPVNKYLGWGDRDLVETTT